MRIFTWIVGVDPRTVLDDRRRSETFFEQLATATRHLHGIGVEEFSSRLDGSAPTFRRWSEYVAYRLPAVLVRVRARRAFERPDAEHLAGIIEQLAHQVDEVATPAICHRDLHLDNLLPDTDGHLVGVVDFDGAEAWDPAIDLVKLRWLVFPNHPGAEEVFTATYGQPVQWESRVRLVELLELLNAIPNAMSAGDRDFEESARKRLAVVLAG